MRRSISPAWFCVLFAALGIGMAAPSRAAEEAGTPPVESGNVEVGGGKIFYETAGSGPAMILIHDGLLHRETWDAQFAVFAKSYRVIRWDRRGYGRSDAPKGVFSHGDDLLALMNALEVERATLMGSSAGGLLALGFVLDYPERVSSLVLVGPIVTGFEFSEHFQRRGDRGMPGRDAPVDQKITYWTAKDPWIMAPESTAARERMRALMIADPQDLTGSGRSARYPGGRARERLAEIKVPTLIIVGESDIPEVHTHIGVIQAGIAGAERVVLTHSGHLCHIEVPEVFNRVVLDFLGKLP